MDKRTIYFIGGALIGSTILVLALRKLLVRFRVSSLAQKEWRGWGSPTINIDGSIVRKGGFEADKGFTDRVAEYWRIGTGQSFKGTDRDVAWSSAFISYLMKMAGAKDKFSYSPSHSTYITDSIENRKQGKLKDNFVGYKINEVSPSVGDLVCYSRQSGVNYDTKSPYKSHCDIVVAKKQNQIDVIGGNVNNAVTKKILRTDDKGKLIDNKYNWFAVIKTNL